MHEQSAVQELRLGLIGDNIGRSMAPLLHEIAGERAGTHVTYDRLEPEALGTEFETLLGQCAARGYRGVNVTHPYKERAARMVRIDDPLVRAIGAVNTVLFERDGPLGFNTDYSGFTSAYRNTRSAGPGAVCLIGAGGVGRTIGFALSALGASEIRLFDLVPARAHALARDLLVAAPQVKVAVQETAEAAAEGADGLINCTPVGMFGNEGTPLRMPARPTARWAFDAVYTPMKTRFLREAMAHGLEAISGYELFIYQGIDAWHRFSGRTVDETALRAALRPGE